MWVRRFDMSGERWNFQCNAFLFWNIIPFVDFANVLAHTGTYCCGYLVIQNEWEWFWNLQECTSRSSDTILLKARASTPLFLEGDHSITKFQFNNSWKYLIYFSVRIELPLFNVQNAVIIRHKTDFIIFSFPVNGLHFHIFGNIFSLENGLLHGWVCCICCNHFSKWPLCFPLVSGGVCSSACCFLRKNMLIF